MVSLHVAMTTGLPEVAGSECWVPVCSVGGSQDVVFQGQNSIQRLLVQTGTVRSVLVPPTEPEAGWIGPLDTRRARRQLLKTDLHLLCYSCRDPNTPEPLQFQHRTRTRTSMHLDSVLLKSQALPAAVNESTSSQPLKPVFTVHIRDQRPFSGPELSQNTFLGSLRNKRKKTLQKLPENLSSVRSCRDIHTLSDL